MIGLVLSQAKQVFVYISSFPNISMLQSLKSVLHLNHGEVEKNSETNVSLIKDTEVPSLEASNEESKPQLIRQNSRNILRIDPH